MYGPSQIFVIYYICNFVFYPKMCSPGFFWVVFNFIVCGKRLNFGSFIKELMQRTLRCDPNSRFYNFTNFKVYPV
jgi:hypothetical protein